MHLAKLILVLWKNTGKVSKFKNKQTEPQKIKPTNKKTKDMV